MLVHSWNSNTIHTLNDMFSQILDIDQRMWDSLGSRNIRKKIKKAFRTGDAIELARRSAIFHTLDPSWEMPRDLRNCLGHRHDLRRGDHMFDYGAYQPRSVVAYQPPSVVAYEPPLASERPETPAPDYRTAWDTPPTRRVETPVPTYQESASSGRFEGDRKDRSGPRFQ